MSETANVGFHAVYVKAEGQAAVSSAGNALVGAYLSQLNLPNSAIVYITDAPPDGMQWRNFVDARQYGIDVQPFNLAARSQPFDLAARSTPKSNGTAPDDSSSLQVSSVKKELFEFVGATNLANELSLS